MLGHQGQKNQNTSNSKAPCSLVESVSFDPVMCFALCMACSIVLARWGGGGRDDIVGQKTFEQDGDFDGTSEVWQWQF